MNAKDRVSDVRPYVERALKDEEVRDHVKSAFLSAKEVYNELLGGRGADRCRGSSGDGRGHPRQASRGARRAPLGGGSRSRPR